jgi:hypothetical protein
MAFDKDRGAGPTVAVIMILGCKNFFIFFRRLKFGTRLRRVARCQFGKSPEMNWLVKARGKNLCSAREN